MIWIGAAAVCGMMFVLWLLHFPMRNASIVDPGWAAGMAILGLIYGGLGEGFAQRRWVLMAMAAVWGFRLSIYLLFRVLGHSEEGRYVEIRRQWGTNIGFKFLLFFEGQALLCLLLAIPFYIAAQNKTSEWTTMEYLGVGVWLISVIGEAIADAQLAAFKRNPSNKGKTCRAGLWSYSRHPNYFFEWLVWVAFTLYAHHWMALLSPVLMLYFLLRVTGIPATEEQALRTKGDDYRDYQRTTSRFVPWFRKSGAL
jgi:steroid 5-alpha reductase family enzyme